MTQPLCFNTPVTYSSRFFHHTSTTPKSEKSGDIPAILSDGLMRCKVKNGKHVVTIIKKLHSFPQTSSKHWHYGLKMIDMQDMLSLLLKLYNIRAIFVKIFHMIWQWFAWSSSKNVVCGKSVLLNLCNICAIFMPRFLDVFRTTKSPRGFLTCSKHFWPTLAKYLL